MSIAARFYIRRGEFVLDVDLRIPSRGVTGLFGPSGSGKTTLLRAVAGLERHRGGLLKLDGVTWQEADQFVPPHRRRLGYVFQEASLFNHLTVRGNLAYGFKRVPRAERRVAMDEAIAWLGLDPLLERKPDSLSGGERQRVAIARALAASPGLILLDEPLAGLDLGSKEEILPYLESLHDELAIPVIYVSHLPDEVARLADHLVLLEGGRVVATGAVNDVLTRLDLPLAHGRDAAAVVETVVAGYDETYQLTHLEFAGGRLTVTGRRLPIGARARVRLAARDVSLTLERQSDTSVLNIFPATVADVATAGDARVTVRLLAGEVPILSRITRKSADQLDLKPGTSVYVQAKSVALLA